MKAPDLLVDAFAKVAQQIPDLDLVIAGPDYGMKRELNEQISRCGLTNRVHMPGAVYGRAKLALLRDAVCMCQPSRHEGFSVSMLEALACGLPVVTTRTANFPEIESEGAGVISAPDADSLATSIARLATQEALRERQSLAARALVDRCYTWQAVEARARDVYKQAIASVGGTCR
jgi:glycosyltransferase involved in cell wall biosynthesis